MMMSLASAHAAPPWVYSGSGPWTPPSGTIGNVYPPNGVAFPMEAVVSESPPQITLRIFSGAANLTANAYNPDLTGSYDVFRKAPNATTWTKVNAAPVAVGTTLATWTDTNVNVGELYEYALATAGTTVKRYGFLLAGIKVDQTQPKGRVALVVANDVVAALPNEYAEFKADLVNDGWVVHEIATTRAGSYTSNGTGPNDALGVPTAPFPGEHINIRNQIIALYNAYPGELKNVILLGRIAVARAGHYGVGPDGHGNRASLGADAYYADMDGVWTDLKSNGPLMVVGTPVTGFINNADGSVTLPTSALAVSQSGLDQVKAFRLQGGGPHTWNVFPYQFTILNGLVTNMTSAVGDTGINAGNGTVNVPGDNKFDGEYMSQIGNGAVELGFGRIDVSSNVPGEMEGLRMYLNKDHRYKTASPDFLPGRRAISRASFGMVSRACLAAMPGVVGMTRIDHIRTTDLPAVGIPEYPNANWDSDQAYTALNGPSLFYFKGSGGPDYSNVGRSVFWTGMQSHWGYWFEPGASSGQNRMARRLAEDTFTLSFTWSIGLYAYDTSYLYHRMGMGFDTGDMMRVSISNRAGKGAPVGTMPVYSDADSPLFMEHMGDPTLRLFMFAPPTDLSVVPSGGNAQLSWTASRPPPPGEPQVIGYHVYRANTANGPFTRLTPSPVAGTSYTDAGVSSGAWTYMVRAVRLETTGGGSFFNASLGARQSIDLTNGAGALSVSTAALPDANWNTGYTTSLAAQGGTPVCNWSLVAGALPTGLALSGAGVISGSATAGGTFNFTVRTTDQLGVTAQRALGIRVQSVNATTFLSEAGRFMNTTLVGQFYEPTLKMVGPTYNYMAFLRFNLASLNANNAFVRARLVLTAHEVSNSIPLLKVALTTDASDAWNEFTVNWASRPPDNTAIAPITAPGFLTPYGTMEIDVTPLVQATLANDPAKKLSLRLFTATPAGFGNEVRIATRYASGNARPRLIIETTNGPAITITSPAVNPASVHAGATLQINAAATAIPALAGSLSVQWSKVSGPGVVTFGSGNLANTTAIFSAPGDYVLRLTANDSVLQTAKDLAVRVLAVPAGTAPVTGPNDSLILRMAFDQSAGATAADLSGSGNTGTLTTLGGTGNPTWGPGGGRIGGAINFDGSGQRVEIADSTTVPLDGMQKLSVSLWVKLNIADANSHAILAKRTSATTTTTSYLITVNTVQKIAISVANRTAVTGDAVLAVGQWYHLVMIYDGSLATNNLQLWINGSPEKYGTISTGQANNIIPRIVAPSRLRVGDYTATASTGTALPLNGQVDELRLYNRVLTLAEIQDLAGGKPANVGPLITLATTVSGNPNQPLALNATVTDDGLPAALTLNWIRQSGPGAVAFSTPNSMMTNATHNQGGAYILRFSASDSAITTLADITTNIAALAAFNQWALDNSLPSDGSGLGAPNANPGGDGVSNAMKFVLGIGVNTPGHGGRVTTGQVNVAGQDYLTLTFIRPDPAPAGAVFTVKTCGDVTSWSAAETIEVSNTVSNNLRTITVRDTQPMGAGMEKRFIRLEVSIP